MIGGGGYVFPRYVEEHWPAARIEVVEIDPAVTRAAHAAFGFPETSKIRVHHADGRVFVNQAHRRIEGSGDFEPYDFIYIDAVNDFSVPFQVTTREFFAKTEGLLAEDGLLLMNFIDVVDSGLLVGALGKTLGDTFEHVALFSSDNLERSDGAWRVTLVLAASNRPIEWSPEHGDRDGRGVRRVDEARFAAYMATPEAIVLEDSFAPIENLVAPVVRASSRDFAAVDALRRALKLEKQGDLAGYVAYCREALRLDPHLPEAHYNLGLGLYRQGRADEAEYHWVRATSIDPDYAEAHYNLGALYYSRGELGAALAHFERTVEIHPTMATAHKALGIAAEAAGDFEIARRHYAESLRLSPQSVETQRHLARLQRGDAARTSTR
jgi:tetratricopeptide (TPR) repeat protein